MNIIRFLTALFLGSSVFAQDLPAVFPGRVITRQDAPYTLNNASTVLTGSISANSRSFTVQNASGWKAPVIVTVSGPAPDFLNPEIILVCTIVGNVFTTCPTGRGFNGTVPVNHKNGDLVQALLVDYHISRTYAEMTAVQTALGPSLANVIKTGQAAGGDLAGNFPNLTVETLKGGKAIPTGDVVGTTDVQSLTNKNITGTFTGSLNGNAASATTAGQLTVNPADCSNGAFAVAIANNGDLSCLTVDWSVVANRPSAMPPNGPAGGDLSGSYPNPTVATVGGKSSTVVASIVDDVAAATSSSTNSTLVRRSSGGAIAASSFVGFLFGNASTATELQTLPTPCPAGQYQTGSYKNGDSICAQVQYSQISGSLTLPNSGVTAGTYGSNVSSVVLTVGADGRITSISNAAIPGTENNGYVAAYNIAGTLLPTRQMLQGERGVELRDNGTRTLIGLAATGVSAGTYGTSSSVPQFTVDQYGRISSASSVSLSLSGSAISSGTVDNARLNATSSNTANQLVLRDGSGNFSAGTINALSLVGPLTGNASSASSVPWAGVSGRPDVVSAGQNTSKKILLASDVNTASYEDAALVMREFTYSGAMTGAISEAPRLGFYWAGRHAGQLALNSSGEFGFYNQDASAVRNLRAGTIYSNGNPVAVNVAGSTYAFNITGNAGSASSIHWGNVFNKPLLVYDDNQTYRINTTGNAGFANAAGTVAWSGVSGRPTSLSQFFNDAGFISSPASNFTATNGVFSSVYGDSGIAAGTSAWKLEVSGNANGSISDFYGKYGSGNTLWSWWVTDNGQATGANKTSIMTLKSFNRGAYLGLWGVTNPGHALELGVDSAAKPGTSTWIILSDARIKDNVRPFTDGLDVLRQINPKMFEFNGRAGSSHDTGIGIIAQDIQPVAPYMVSTVRKSLDPGGPPEDILSFNGHAMTWILTNAVKEMDSRILHPVDVTVPQPPCNEAKRTHSRFVRDDLEGDRIEACGRDAEGNYMWKPILRYTDF